MKFDRIVLLCWHKRTGEEPNFDDLMLLERTADCSDEPFILERSPRCKEMHVESESKAF